MDHLHVLGVSYRLNIRDIERLLHSHFYISMSITFANAVRLRFMSAHVLTVTEFCNMKMPIVIALYYFRFHVVQMFLRLRRRRARWVLPSVCSHTASRRTVLSAHVDRVCQVNQVKYVRG
jgi:hypothetical protein